MDYVSPVNELEQRLKEAGEHLAFPPSSTKDLLDLLDKTEQLLTFVSQAPSISMQGALVPSMGALVSDGLLKHAELDVRVSVASCICEVARITAPQPPYRDELMKEIFKLNVLAFGQLSNMTSQSYHKAVHILESVAKVKSCLLMLDLECDALVFEMFETFLSQISVNHPLTACSDIEAIMTVIIQESDEIATELLSLLISHVRKENQIVTPASWKIAERVLRNCNDTLASYSETILKLINSNPDDYAEVVTILCHKSPENDNVVTRSRRTNSTHKRDRNTLENGGSTKKQKSIDKNHFKGKHLETSRQGRPRKDKSILNQDNSSNSVQTSQKNMRTRFKKQSSKTKGNIGNSGSLDSVVIKTEDETLSDYDGSGPLTQRKSSNRKRRRKSSSNLRASNGSRGKEIPKKWGQELVGHRIKVWWPLDKMYYEGAVSSYNSLDDKHKVLYADGDEEVLDLHREKWMMLDEILPDPQQEKAADLPSAKSTSAKRRKPNRKRNLEASLKQEEISNSPKSLPHADSSKTADAVCNADDPVSTPADSSKTANDDHKNGLFSTPADSSNTAYDKYKSNFVSTAGVACELKLTETKTDDMENNGDLKTNGDLQEKKPDESSDITQKLENTENLNCEI